MEIGGIFNCSMSLFKQNYRILCSTGINLDDIQDCYKKFEYVFDYSW